MSDPTGQDYRERAGIEHGSRLRGITYNRSAGVIIAQFYEDQLGSVYYRARASLRYQKITRLGERLTYRDLVTAASAPVALVSVMELQTDSEGIDWHSVARIDLQSGTIIPAFSREDVQVERPYTVGWVRELHEAWVDGTGAVCTMGFLRNPTSAEEDAWNVEGQGKLVGTAEYWICDLDLTRKTYERLTQLVGLHF